MHMLQTVKNEFVTFIRKQRCFFYRFEIDFQAVF